MRNACEHEPGAIARFAGLFMAVTGVLGHLYWAINSGLVREGHWVGIDFHVYYQAALVLRRGGDIYHAGISPLYVYPPTLAVLVMPLSFLPADDATIIWKLLQYACLLLAGVLLTNLLHRRVRPLAAGLLMLGWLTSPVRDEIQFGESNSLVLVLVVGAIWLIARGETGANGPGSWGTHGMESRTPWLGRPWFVGLAGLLLSLAVSIKVLPVLVVAYLWWRGPRLAAGTATAGFLLLQGITLAITPGTAYYWLVEFPGLFGQAFPFPDNQSLNALIARALLSSDPALPPTRLADGAAVRPALTWAANIATVSAAVGVLWVSHRRSSPTTEVGRNVRLLLQVGLVWLTTHLVSGSTWVHHLVALSIPVTALSGAVWETWTRFKPIREGMGMADSSVFAGCALWPALLCGLAYGLLLPRPSEWWLAVGQIAYGNALLTLVASSTGTWVVVALWLGVAAALLQTATPTAGDLPT
jgi:hypothetical protein